MKNVRSKKDCTDTRFFFYNLSFPCCEYYYEKESYLESKDLNNIKHYVLSILERLGFSIEEYGTYLFRDLILKVSEFMELYEDTEVLEMLNNPYSQLYFDIARNEMEMGCKSFHSFIEQSVTLYNRCLKNVDLNKQYKLDEISYGECAFKIADHLRKNNIGEYKVLKKEIG